MSDRPNVLLVCCDHWPASLLGVAGHPAIQTPTLDQIARNGVRYTNAYSECPVCVPARQTLMTGTTPRTHGDRVYRDGVPKPDLPWMAQCFRDAGYQAFASGKMHTWPQRNHCGFDDVMLAEEGRLQFGVIDDHAIALGDAGFPGQQFATGMCNNEYLHAPWPLPEELHVTNWTTKQICRYIQRRDPRKPGFYYVSYCHPHPPFTPLRDYLEMYRDFPIDDPHVGEWAEDPEALPWLLRKMNQGESHPTTPDAVRAARRAFYALCTHIDHQLRVVVGTLREEGLLDNTVLLFTSDHGDMLGNHGLWAKRVFFENSANVPMLLMGTAGDERVGHHCVDDRLVGWQDIMPTLLDLCGLPIPDSVDGRSMVTGDKRDTLYGECGEGAGANRMIHDGRFKLIYYPVGNRFQLFDLDNDPQEMRDLAAQPGHEQVIERLTAQLIGELYGGDVEWIENGRLVGMPDREFTPAPNRALGGQRGLHWPPPKWGSGA